MLVREFKIAAFVAALIYLVSLPIAPASLRGIALSGNGSRIAVGEAGAILEVSDGGLNRVKEPPSTQAWLESVQFSQGVGWIVGMCGAIFKSADGGKSWSLLAPPTDRDLHAVSFLDDRRGAIAGAGGEVLFTDDGGATWKRRPAPTGATLTGVAFSTAGRLIAVGHAGSMWVTDDMGANWRQRVVDGITKNANLEGICNAPGSRLVCWGAHGIIMDSGDSGETWSKSFAGGGATLRGFCAGKGAWVAVGDGGAVAVSRDSGKSWKSWNIPEAGSLLAVASGAGTGFCAAMESGGVCHFGIGDKSSQLSDVRFARLKEDPAGPESGPTRSERFAAACRGFMGTPYRRDPLGEGPGAPVDPDPLLDRNYIDCVTFVETSLAVAVGSSFGAELVALDQIRYWCGQEDFTRRKHFFVADWIPGNSWITEDVTTNIAGLEAVYERRRMGRDRFYRERGLTAPGADEELGTFYIPSKRFEKVSVHLAFPLIAVLVGRDDWLFARHAGVLLPGQDGRGPLFCHASSRGKTYAEEPFFEYLRKHREFVGVKLLALRGTSWRSQGAPPDDARGSRNGSAGGEKVQSGG